MKMTVALILLIFSVTVNSQTVEKSFDLSTLPSDWVKLTETDSGLVIYNTCGAGNRLLTILQENDKYGILLHGLQEDYSYEVLEAHQFNEIIEIKAKWKDSEQLQNFKFSWLDRENGIGVWETTYFSGRFDKFKFSTFERQFYYPIVDQPCSECWGDECDYFPIEKIKRIFSDYVKFNESTDSPNDKDEMEKSLSRLRKLKNPNDIKLVLNVWLYYDPTDFPTRQLVFKIFRENKEKSILAIKHRMENPRKGESLETAPFNDLTGLLNNLENE
jgi:hypothetical protein